MGMPYDLIWLAVPANFVMQLLALARTSGGGRIAAGAPLLVMIPIFVVTAVNFANQSNLWPLPLLFASPIALLYVTVAVLAAPTRSEAASPL